LTIDFSTLDQEIITGVVGDALSSSGSIDRIEPLDTWRTRNSAFWLFRAYPAEMVPPFDVVFKVERRWTPETAEGTYEALLRLSDLRDLTPGPSANISSLSHWVGPGNLPGWSCPTSKAWSSSTCWPTKGMPCGAIPTGFPRS